MRDGCTESIKDFWTRTGKNPTLDFYPDKDGDPGMRCWMCGWKSDKQNKARGLQMHIRRKGHKWDKKRVHLTERRDIKYDKLEKLQAQLPQVFWGNTDIDYC